MDGIPDSVMQGYDQYHSATDLQNQGNGFSDQSWDEVDAILDDMNITFDGSSDLNLDGNDEANETSDKLIGLWAQFMSTDRGKAADDQNRQVEFRNWLQSEYGLTLEEASTIMGALDSLMHDETEVEDGETLEEGEMTFADRVQAQIEANEAADVDADAGETAKEGESEDV